MAGDYLVYSYNLQLFAKDGEGGEKTEPATPKKLDKAREEGQAPKSQDLNTAILLLVLFGVIGAFSVTLFMAILNLILCIFTNNLRAHIEETTSLITGAINGVVWLFLLWSEKFEGKK